MIRRLALLSLLLVVSACGDRLVDGQAVTTDASAPTSTSPPASSQEPGPASPIAVNVTDIERLINVDSVRKWARDVDRGDEATLIRKCWTMPPSYIRDKYLAPRRADLSSILAQTPEPAQAGIVWRTPNGASVLVTWAEGKSDYACPKVDLTGSDPISDDYIAYRVKRYILRTHGTPVRPDDTEQNYWLECNLQPGDLRAAPRADPDSITVTSVRNHEWRVSAGSVVFDVRYEPAEPCLQSAS